MDAGVDEQIAPQLNHSSMPQTASITGFRAIDCVISL